MNKISKEEAHERLENVKLNIVQLLLAITNFQKHWSEVFQKHQNIENKELFIETSLEFQNSEEFLGEHVDQLMESIYKIGVPLEGMDELARLNINFVENMLNHVSLQCKVFHKELLDYMDDYFQLHSNHSKDEQFKPQIFSQYNLIFLKRQYRKLNKSMLQVQSCFEINQNVFLKSLQTVLKLSK